MAPPSDEDQTTLSYRLRITPAGARHVVSRRVSATGSTCSTSPTPYRELVDPGDELRADPPPAGAEPARPGGRAWPGEGPVADRGDRVPPAQPAGRPHAPALDEFVASLLVRRERLAGRRSRALDGGRRRRGSSTRRRSPRPGRRSARPWRWAGASARTSPTCSSAPAGGSACPARYVSGYVNHPGELATHAWCQVWAGEPVGWVDVDPTHGEFVGDDYVVDRRRPRLLRRPPEPRPLEGPGRGDDHRHRQGRAGRSRPARVERLERSGLPIDGAGGPEPVPALRTGRTRLQRQSARPIPTSDSREGRCIISRVNSSNSNNHDQAGPRRESSMSSDSDDFNPLCGPQSRPESTRVVPDRDLA